MRYLLLIALVAGAISLSAETTLSPEKASYGLRWGFVSVGTVEITLQPNPESPDGGWVAVLDAQANAFMRKVHDFRTIITSEFPDDVSRSEGYDRDEQAPGDTHETFFDWEENTARYSKNGDVRVPILLPGPVQDPLSIVFAFRTGAVPFEVGTHRIWVTDGKVVEECVFEITGPETVKTPAGKFETLRIAADFKGVRAIFARPEGAPIHVWLTNDEKRIPVKLKSEATIGSFRSVLQNYEPGNDRNGGK